jgi:hypothetical protein
LDSARYQPIAFFSKHLIAEKLQAKANNRPAEARLKHSVSRGYAGEHSIAFFAVHLLINPPH